MSYWCWMVSSIPADMWAASSDGLCVSGLRFSNDCSVNQLQVLCLSEVTSNCLQCLMILDTMMPERSFSVVTTHGMGRLLDGDLWWAGLSCLGLTFTRIWFITKGHKIGPFSSEIWGILYQNLMLSNTSYLDSWIFDIVMVTAMVRS